MGRIAVAVLLLLLEIVCLAHSASNVDPAAEEKASLVSGVAPPSQLGSEVVNAFTCRNGNTTWGACGGSSPAGITYATTAQNWSESHTASLTGGSASSLTLVAGHSGIDVASGYGYQVYISDGANSEVVSVTGGTYTSGAGGTILFAPYFSHGPSAYTVQSASSGIQETWNIACGMSQYYWQNLQCNVIIPANGPNYSLPLYNTYNIYGTIFLHSNQSALSGYGVVLNCIERGPCIQVGDLTNSNDFSSVTVQGISFRTPTNYSSNPAYAGVNITNTLVTGGVATITTAQNHGFRPGDMVTILFTDDSSYWGDAIVTSVPTLNTFTYAHLKNSGSIPSQATPGLVALAYEAFLDNAQGTHFADINYGYAGLFGVFNTFFDFWDDENALIDHFNNNSYSLNDSLTWTGSFIASWGAANSLGSSQQYAPVIVVRDSTITANYSDCVTDYNSNGLYVENSVCQASGPWEFFSSNTTGNYQGAYLKNIYSEASLSDNGFVSVPGSVTRGAFQIYEQVIQGTSGASAYIENAPTGSQAMQLTAVTGTPDASHTWVGQTSSAVYTPTKMPRAQSPFPGLGYAGLIAGLSSAASSYEIEGTGGVGGGFETGGAGSTKYTYYIVGHDVTARTYTSPMQVLNWSSTGTDQIPVNWPRLSKGTDVITYDVIRMATSVGSTGTAFPYIGGCPGGSGGTCGSVATGISQATACTGNGGLDCQFVDVGSSTTSTYTINGGSYVGHLLFWPGSIVSAGSNVVVAQEASPVVAVIGGTTGPIQTPSQCTSYGASSGGGGWSECLFVHAVPSIGNQTATLLTDGTSVGAGQTFTKGRLNFLPSGTNIAPHHIITLVDSQPNLTTATPTYRPPASANDLWIGTDVGTTLSTTGLAFGSPVSITNYIGATGDGVHTNWLERLTSKEETFAVPVRIKQGNSFTLGDGSPLSEMKIYGVNVPASHVPPQSCVDVVGEAKDLTKSDQITSITPPGRLGNLSLNTYPAHEGAIILHFCNASGSEAITPPGTYSFLAVR